MNKRDKAREAQQVRAMLLRINAVHHTHGVYAYALRAAHGRTIPKMLHELAQVIANNTPMTIDERIFLIQMLSALAEGFDVREKLRIAPRKVGHNPAQAALNAELAQEVDQRIADGEGPTKAVASVAAIVGKEPEAVRTTWRRARRKGGQ